MKPTENHILQLSSGDVSAILAALSFAAHSNAGNFALDNKNNAILLSIAEKLSNRETHFSKSDRVGICFALSLALDFISGRSIDFLDTSGIDAELNAQLRNNYFVYSRLLPYFERLANDM